MKLTYSSVRRSGVAVFAVAAMLAVLGSYPMARGQDQAQLAEPFYRVANETTADQPQVAPAAVAPAVALVPFDFTLREGEHPLAPFVRVCKESMAHIDANIQDYSCTLIKQERVDGDLGEPQYISMKVRHAPFSVYMRFLQPYAGREVLYVDGQNKNEMFVLESGWKRSVLGKLSLNPESAIAMRGQKYPITNVGFRNLLTKLVAHSEADMQFAECEVTYEDYKFGDRPTTIVKIKHPIPRQNFRAHVARLFFDKELRVPIHYDAYLWPDQPGQEPPLDVRYTYTNLKLNNGYTAREFDSENPEIFRP
jgi:hypothetical protein